MYYGKSKKFSRMAVARRQGDIMAYHGERREMKRRVFIWKPILLGQNMTAPTTYLNWLVEGGHNTMELI